MKGFVNLQKKHGCDKMKKEVVKKITEIVCRAWKELDASILAPILSEDFTYDSFWVYATLKGKDTYLDYLTGKFEAIRNGDKPVSAEVRYLEPKGKYVVILNQMGNLAALEPLIQDDMLKSLWIRPVEFVSPGTQIIKKPKQPKEEKTETEYSKFSKLFLDALMTKDFSKVEKYLAEDVIQIVYDCKEISGRQEVISYWLGWLERWGEPNPTTKYEVKFCKYYDRDVLSMQARGYTNQYQMARIEDGKVKQLVWCPNPTQNPMIRYWDLDREPLLWSNGSLMSHHMGDDIEPRPYRIPCMRCGCKSEKLQWGEYTHDTGPLRYSGELSECTNCMEAVEFRPTILMRQS